ncbi:MAG: CPBP family intramembrane glutamic endopeptidase [Bacillota bacterium]|nr:CPBP family intramembrane glutamic endopeptidase [Bacillota bacterium]
MESPIDIEKKQWIALVIYFGTYIMSDLIDSIYDFSHLTLVTFSFFHFSLLLFLIIYLLKKDLSITVFNKEQASTRKSLLIIFMSLFIIVIGLIIISLLRSLLLSTPNENPTVNILKSFPIMIIPMVFMAPIIEEIIFRRILLVSFTKKYNLLGAVVIVSLIFAAWHQSLSSFPNYFFLSVVYSYSYYLSNRLMVPVILHVLWNLIASSIQIFLI